jgi:hypothetical protein
MAATYELVSDAVNGLKGIRCKICNLTSWNPNDVEQKYCGNCHIFHGNLTSEDYQP